MSMQSVYLVSRICGEIWACNVQDVEKLITDVFETLFEGGVEV